MEGKAGRGTGRFLPGFNHTSTPTSAAEHTSQKAHPLFLRIGGQSASDRSEAGDYLYPPVRRNTLPVEPLRTETAEYPIPSRHERPGPVGSNFCRLTPEIRSRHSKAKRGVMHSLGRFTVDDTPGTIYRLNKPGQGIRFATQRFETT